MTTLDPTEEIRAIKRKLSDACGNDIHRIAEEARHNYRASRTATVSKAPSTLSAQDTMNKPMNPSGESSVS